MIYVLLDCYIWKNGRAVACEDHREWMFWFETAENRVIVTRIGRMEVSTVFLSVNHNFFNKKKPILFETMVFGPNAQIYERRRYGTLAEAVKGHREIVETVRARHRRSRVKTRRFKLGGIREIQCEWK